jgi:hypothetical protein
MKPHISIALALLPALVAAQTPPARDHGHGPAPAITDGGVLPPGWQARPDEGGKLSEIKMETMAPGWHLTTAASAIFYRPADHAAGAYQVSAKLHLFPERAGHREAYGVLIGGQDLAGAGQKYTYFLLRGDGTFKIKRRSGGATSDVTSGWTPSGAIKQGSPEGPVANVVDIVVRPDKVSFRVNGQEVYSAPKAGVDTDGITGLRINHNLSVHVESFAITKP